MSATEEQVRAVVLKTLGGIAPEADLSTVAADANLRRELDLDSIDFQNFLIGVSRELKVDVPERGAAKLTTLAGCVKYFSG